MTAVLIANNIPGPLPLDVAHDVCEQLVRTGRAIHPARWVPELQDLANQEVNDDLL